jgi:hypothetical protein
MRKAGALRNRADTTAGHANGGQSEPNAFTDGGNIRVRIAGLAEQVRLRIRASAGQVSTRERFSPSSIFAEMLPRGLSTHLVNDNHFFPLATIIICQ